MNSLKQLGLDIYTGSVSNWSEALNKINETISCGFFILETPTEYIVDLLDNLPSKLEDKTLSITVFNEQLELSFENNYEQIFFREISEVEGNDIYTRCNSYYLSELPATENLLNNNLTKLRHKEYFELTKSGMPVLKCSRLCGFE